ncbi:MAG: hypothetical protein COT71_03245 [Candidatus Andersenbacteria bacterium CG10_big_fil_rev_8_21_14_0_10_54_11]|uniref:Uncharacterized protein n=1 Tax=Candidatus Andersenbacteria bacterium CG10_big_fil_rev_8_21_14_0_10_54_11 TaxID=1974485 RepID=A0A2M6WYQ8_9BACT|nr:MAG: hypothetical protein COT71_03245 [Candidatus Andersenbacteria bacterium CG10_big_fil_rev_8_21_14_0_10_54_11]
MVEREITPEMYGRLLRILWTDGPSTVVHLCGQYRVQYRSSTAHLLIPDALCRMEAAEFVARERGWRTWWKRWVRRQQLGPYTFFKVRHPHWIYWAIVSESQVRRALHDDLSEPAQRILAGIDEFV